jgi:GNAT superfamily N-acetyltransferase
VLLMVYRIRAVDVSEFGDDIVEMDQACLKEDLIKPELTDYWWIAFLDDVPVAYAGLRPSSLYKRTGFLARAGVLKAHLGNGLQRRLIRVRERAARKHGWVRLVSYTRNNPPSANNLIACGYKAFTPNKPWAAADATYWHKFL